MILRVPQGNVLARPEGRRRTVDERRSHPDVGTAPAIDGVLWVGLVEPTAVDGFCEALRSGVAEAADGVVPEGVGSLNYLAVKLTWSVYHLMNVLQDPVGELPGPMEFQVFLRRAVEACRSRSQSIAVLLVNPDDFAMINHRYGREHGDSVVAEIATQLASSVRLTDGVFRYGGAVFALVLPATDMDQCHAAVQKIRQHMAEHAYVDGTVKMTFSMGAAVADASQLLSDVSLQLLQRADAALNTAKLSGGSRVVVTDVDNEEMVSPLDPLGGIFAADTEKDYRNMLLLWETVALVSASPEPEAMARAFVDRVAMAFQPERVALFTRRGERGAEAVATSDGLVPLATSVRDDTSADGRTSARLIKLEPSDNELIGRAIESGRAERSRDKSRGQLRVVYAVPLVAGEVTMGCLFLDGRERGFNIDSSDVIFLNALACQMAVALDRADLASRWIREKDRESRMLREELRDLRQALQHTKMVYQSSAMHGVLETLRKVAPSDATVLIIGESGTGKEMLAQSLHEFSNRREKPFVVFDCGAVAHSLLEAELFGHVKGAYTGAESAAEGRISQADGGTLFLDEIGELPMSVQAKLLRFVQEKEFAPVGSAKSRTVDVRIVAATNRELQVEVGAGRFRADLYYRLRVIAVQAVPLRDRTDDILPLSHYFLEKFSAQYGATARTFSQPAEQRLLHYGWPGNVRELQHCVMRAVLTNDAEVIGPEAIELYPDATHEAGPPTLAVVTPGPPADPDPVIDVKAEHENPWQAMSAELERQVGQALSDDAKRPSPLGRWLTEDLVMGANELCGNVARRAAHLVGVPESTFRRHLEKATGGAMNGASFRGPGWVAMGPLIDLVLDCSGQQPANDLLEHARCLLLDRVTQVTAGRPGVGAALMAVTPPTYKRWLQARERAA